jgi:alpha-L-rhamnosidase
MMRDGSESSMRARWRFGMTAPERRPSMWLSKRAVTAVASCLFLAIVAAPRADGRESAAQGSHARLAVTDLRIENEREPLGIDEQRPRLSWVLESTTRGQAQTAYKVQVATSPGLLRADRPDVWDGDKVKSSDSVNVVYGGPALTSATRYWWRVRAWDADHQPSAWTDPTWWETGLLRQSDWHAEWIGRPIDSSEAPPPDLEGSQWIWYPEGDPGTSAPPGTRYFRRSVTIPAGKTVETARLLLTVDDSFIAYLNGREIARSTGTWQQAVTVDVTGQLHSGNNALAIEGTNAGNSPAGALGVLEVTFADDTTLMIRTDHQWKAFNAAVPGWNETGFDDIDWPAALELAPFGEGVWTCCGGVNTSPPYSSVDPLLRKEFSVTKPVQQARAYVSGLGYHELRLNGRKVGDSVLETDVNDYDERVGYTSYDVTPYLEHDANAIGVMLGRGFYDVHQTTPLDWHLAPWRDKPKLLLQLEIRYTDGTSETIVSDGTWKTANGPITYDSVFGGEDFDARLETPGWDTPAFDAPGWEPARLVDAPAGRLVATNNDPVEVAETLRHVAMTEPEPGVYVLDMGRTITGWGRLEVSGAAGTTITLRYGQKLLPDGTVDYHNGWHGGRSQTDRYILKGEGTEIWEPRFSFKSFRYLQVAGLPSPPEADTVVARSVHSAVASAGSFDSSNALYDTFHEGMRRTTLGNLQGYPAVDPFYEKSGWTEDVFVAAQSMIYEFDMSRFFNEWLEDIRDSQLPDGHIPIIIPSPGWGYTSWGTPSPVWTAVYPIMAWRMYENYGDRRLLAEHFPAIKKYIDREISLLQDGIVATEFLGDYVSPGYFVPPEDTRLAGTAYVYRQLKLVTDMAEVLGRPDAQYYRRRAEFVRERFNATFLDEEKGHYETDSDPGYRQTSNLLPLAFGMVPEGDEERVLESVVVDVRARGNHLDTGTLGTEVILPVLTENGYADVAHAIANQRTYPSWGHWYANGADTMWETWDLNPRSRAHFFLGTVDEWLFEDLAGIEAAAPGFKRIAIRPHPGEDLAKAKGRYVSVHGEIESEWEAEDGDFKLEVTIPVNTTATVSVPAEGVSSVTESGVPAASAPGVRFVQTQDGYAVFEVGSGKYSFESSD